MKIVWKTRSDGAWFGYRLNHLRVMEKRPRIKINKKHGFSNKWEAIALMWADPEEPIASLDYEFPNRSWTVAEADTVTGVIAAAELSPLIENDKWEN